MGNKIGRPTTYDATTADAICLRLAEGESLLSICAEKGMPGRATVYQWLNANPPFADNYARARQHQADTFADEVIYIADNATDAGIARLQVDARKWAAGQMKPGAWGPRVDVGGNITVTIAQADADL